MTSTDDHELVREFFAIGDRFRLRAEGLSTFTGLAIHTVRSMRMTMSLPARERCRRAVAYFVRRNCCAESREELRLPPLSEVEGVDPQ